MNNLTPSPNDLIDEENPFTKPEVAALWIQCVENVSGEFRDLHIYPRLRAWESELGDGQILEIGCGQGVCCQILPVDRHYLGIEPSEPLIKRAVEQYQTSVRSFVKGSAYDLPVSDGSCVGVFSVNVWMHLSDLNVAARELSRALTTTGGVLVITANPEGYREWEEKHFHTQRAPGRISGGFHLPDNIDLPEHLLFTHPLQDLIDSFSSAGISVVETQTFGKGSEEGSADWFVAIRGVRR